MHEDAKSKMFTAIGSLQSHPRTDDMFTCELHDEKGNRALVRMGDLVNCPLCAAAFIASVAIGVADKIHKRMSRLDPPTPDNDDQVAPPPVIVAAGIVMQAFERISEGRWHPGQFAVVALGKGEVMGDARIKATHPLLPPDAFMGALLEVDVGKVASWHDADTHGQEKAPAPTAPGPVETQ